MNRPVRRHKSVRGMIRRDDETRPLDADTAALLAKGWRLKQQMAAAEQRLREINDALIARHGVGAVLVLAGVCRATTAARQTATVEDAERLRAVLGKRFGDLVAEEVRYRPEARLVELALSADEPLAPALRAALSLREAQSVTWRAEAAS
jgi:hypothetical protein